MFYVLMAVYSGVDVAANLALKRWIDAPAGQRRGWLTLALVLYVGCGAAWGASLRYKPFHQAQLLYAPVALLCGVAIVAGTSGGEHLTLRTLAACLLALWACLLLEGA